MTYAGIRNSLRNSYLISSRYGLMSVAPVSECEEGFFEVGAGDLEVGEGRIAGDERAHDGVAVRRRDFDRAVVIVDAEDARHRGDVVDRDRRLAANLSPRRARLDRLRRPLGHETAAVDDDDAVGERVGLRELVRRQQHGAAAADEAADLLPQPAARLDGGSRGRLLEGGRLRGGGDGPG